MPTLHNPAGNSLFCARLERILGINERVEITDEEAADLVGTVIFIVEGYEAPEQAERPDAAAADADEEKAESRKVETVKRGSKRVETRG